MQVFLITVLYNSRNSIENFLSCLQAQEYRNWKLIAIDNASGDCADQICLDAADPRIIVLRNRKNLGFSKAVNQGLMAAAASGEEFFIIINNDVAFGPNFLSQFIDAKQRLDAPVIAPRIMSLSAPEIAWYAGGYLEFGWVFRNVHEREVHEVTAERQVDYASGCCLGIAHDVLQEVGLLDESLFVYWEDTDFCLRLKQRAIPIFYADEVCIFHEGGASSGGEYSPSYYKLYDRSYMQLLRKHFGFQYACFSIVKLLKQHLLHHKPGRLLITRFCSMMYGIFSPLTPVRHLK